MTAATTLSGDDEHDLARREEETEETGEVVLMSIQHLFVGSKTIGRTGRRAMCRALLNAKRAPLSGTLRPAADGPASMSVGDCGGSMKRGTQLSAFDSDRAARRSVLASARPRLPRSQRNFPGSSSRPSSLCRLRRGRSPLWGPPARRFAYWGEEPIDGIRPSRSPSSRRAIPPNSSPGRPADWRDSRVRPALMGNRAP